jgi:transcriptional/translational regulatory protein YebC/TACO1
MYSNRAEGALGTSGSVSFLFERKVMFKVDATGLDKDNTELDLIDYGAEELNWDEENNELIVQTAFTDFGKMQAGLEEKKYNLKESSKIFIPTTTQEISPEKEADVMALIEKMEEDDDIVAVYHNIA